MSWPALRAIVCRNRRGRRISCRRITRGRNRGRWSRRRCGNEVLVPGAEGIETRCAEAMGAVNRPPRRRRRLNIQRRCEIEGGTFLGDGVESNLTSVLFDDEPGDGQSEAVAAHFGLQVVIGLVKAFEYMRLVFDRNAVASIFNRDHEGAFVVGKGANGDGSSRGGVFDGVGDQVIEYLLHTLRIDIQYRGWHGNFLVEDDGGFD